MANTLTVVIAFLAKFAGLGGIPDKLVGIVKKIREPIDKGLDKIVAWLGKMLEQAGQRRQGDGARSCSSGERRYRSAAATSRTR